MAVNWYTNEILLVDGEPFYVRGQSKSGDWNLEHVHTRRFETLTDEALTTLWTQRKVDRVPFVGPKLSKKEENVLRVVKRPYGDLPVKSQAGAERKAPYMRAYVADKLRKKTPRVLEPLIARVAEEIGDKEPPSVRKLKRWLEEWEKLGSPDLRDIRCIAPRTHLRGNKEDRFDPEVDEVVWDTVEELHLNRTPATVEKIWQAVTARVDAIDLDGKEERYIEVVHGSRRLKRPSIRSIYRYVLAIDVKIAVEAQLGRLQAERQCDPVVLGPIARRPLEAVEIDHTRLDVMVLDDRRKGVRARPWITVVLDRCTRVILAFIVSFRTPSANTVIRALKMAIAPKGELLKKFANVKGTWNCFGLMAVVVLDNGAEFHAKNLKYAFKALGIEPFYCPVKKPRYKGKVERFFGRLARQLIHTLAGTTFSNTTRRGDYDSKKEAVLTISELMELILKWIVEDYHVRIHRGIDDAPIRKWEELTKLNPVQLPARMEDLDLLESDIHFVNLSREGIKFRGLDFSSKSPEFRELVNRPDKPEKVQIRVDEEDTVDHISVQDWRTGTYLEVPCVSDPEYIRGRTWAEHELAQERAKEKLAPYQRATTAHLIQADREIRDMVKDIERRGRMNARLHVALGDAEPAVGMSEEPRRRRGRPPKSASKAGPEARPSADVAEDATPSGEDLAVFAARAQDLGVSSDRLD